ncbi:MAG: hypothetical protein Q7S28_02695 [bacterium]|nr:hypothetical protein [bacterium]
MQEYFSSLIPLQIYAASIFFLAYYLESRNCDEESVAKIDLQKKDRHWALQMLYMIVGMTAVLYLIAIILGGTGSASGAENSGSGIPIQFIFGPLSALYVFGFTRYVAKNIAAQKGVVAEHVVPALVALAVTAWWVLSPNWLSLNIAATIIMLYVLVLARFMNIYTAILILSALAVYDVINVFGTGLMLKAAMPSIGVAPLLVVVPASLSLSAQRVSALGLGDIVIPGLAILAAFRESKIKKNPLFSILAISFYLLALATAFVAVRLTKSPQPALLYISPAVIAALLLATPLWNAWKRVRGLPQGQ